MKIGKPRCKSMVKQNNMKKRQLKPVKISKTVKLGKPQ